MRYLDKKVVAMLTIIFLTLLASTEGPAQNQPAAGEKGRPEKITLNFIDVEISSLVKIMSELTGKNFLYDETLKGKVTIIAPAKLTGEEALSLFISALDLKNFTIIPVGKAAYKIIPSSMARQSGTNVLKGGERARSDEYIVRLMPLEYISAQEAFPVVQPLVSRNGQVSVFGTRNALVVVDTAQNIEKILKILASVDRPPATGAPEIVYLRYAEAARAVEMLRKEESRMTGGLRRGGTEDSESNITADTRLNAIIFSSAIKDIEFYRKYLSLIDVPPPETSSRINVHYLENADAETLSKVLETLTMPGGAQAALIEGGARTGAAQEIGGGISITPDSATNSLLIMASPEDYRNLVQVVKKLDRRPKQVFVEAMIVEVTVDKAIELGTKFRATAEKDGSPVAIGGVGTIDSTAIQDILTGLSGFTLGGLGNFLTVPVTLSDGTTTNLTAPGFAALFSLSDFRDVVNVLSTPHVLTSDNSDAEIMVGQNVPFLSKIERETGTTAQPLLQSIERRDVGIRLKIKPKISEGDFVKLDIYQEISAISPTRTAGASDIILTKRSAETGVVVKNSQTVVIGGLIQNRNTSSETKVPFLADIPFIGWLFKFKNDRNEKTNLLVFITPYIVDDFRGLEGIRERKKSEFEEESRTMVRRRNNGAERKKDGTRTK